MRSKSTRMRIGFIVATLAIRALATPASSLPLVVAVQEPLDARAVTPFLRELQRAIARDDRQAVAAQVQYPLMVTAGGIRIPIADAASLVAAYDVVFSPALKAIVGQASLPARGRAEPAYPVTIEADTVTVGDDLIRVQRVGGRLKITRMKLPSAPLAGPSPAPSRATAGSRGPRRLNLQVGEARLSGTLAPAGRDVYLLSATRNQLLEVRIDGVAGRSIVAHVVGAKNRAPIDAHARDGARTWTGRVPEDGDYRIEVVRPGPSGEPYLPYIIVVGMR
jgi:hypothetical protein